MFSHLCFSSSIIHDMIQVSKGHAFHACMKKHDFGTRKHRKAAIFRRKMSRALEF